MLHLHQLGAPENRLDGVLLISRRLFDYPLFFLARRVPNGDLQHEAIELRLGQRISAFLLDRVLRRQNEERLG